MIKSLSAYMNVALEDYDESMRNHIVDLLKESLREQSNDIIILETTWKVEENKRKLFKNKEGLWGAQPTDGISLVDLDKSKILEVMTVGITVDVESMFQE